MTDSNYDPTLAERLLRFPGTKHKGNSHHDPEEDGGELECVTAADVKMRAISWLWPNRFALGKLGLIGGLPDKGKGLICAHIIACATANIPLPCNEGQITQGHVIWLTAEDDIEDTVVPRLRAAGADLTRVHIVKMLRKAGKRQMFSLVTDLPALQRKIEEIGNVVLIIIDPMTAYVGVRKINNHSATEVRGFLAPLVDLASDKKLSVIGIMHFNKKDDVTNAMLRIADSLAYVAAARHVYFVCDDAEVENRRLFVKAKNNLSPDSKALSYFTSAKLVGTDEETATEIWAPYVEWGIEHVKVTAAEAMQAASGPSSGHAKHEARQFLLERLEHGPIKSDELIEEAEQNGIAERTLKRAKRDLGIKAKKERGKTDGGWMWELPPKAPSGYQVDD